MAHLQRYLRHFCVLLGGFLAAHLGHAQQPAPKPVTFRAIAVGNSVSALLYELAPGKVIPLYAGSSDLSRPYVSPSDGVVSFYREAPPEKPGEAPRRIPIAKAHLGKAGPYLVVISISSNGTDGRPVETLVVDDSWDAHPMQTVRVFNFSKRRAAVQAGTQNQELASAESHIFPYPEGKGSIGFKVALMEENGWVLKMSCPQGIIPKTRSTLIITDAPPTVEDPNPVDINVANVFDFTQPPPPAPAP